MIGIEAAFNDELFSSYVDKENTSGISIDIFNSESGNDHSFVGFNSDNFDIKKSRCFFNKQLEIGDKLIIRIKDVDSESESITRETFSSDEPTAEEKALYKKQLDEQILSIEKVLKQRGLI